MKAILDKAVSILTRGDSLERSHAVQLAESVEASEEPTLCRKSSEQLPSEPTSDISDDNVLFRKNGVFFKFHDTAPDDDSLSTDTPHPLQSEEAATRMDSHVLVPGYLFMTSRGSSFGSTLILNWASNRALTQSCASCSTQGQVATPPTRNHAEAQQPCAYASGHHGFSVSVDLCTMEVIRLFQRRDEEGSGELVIKSEDQAFKVSTE